MIGYAMNRITHLEIEIDKLKKQLKVLRENRALMAVCEASQDGTLKKLIEKAVKEYEDKC